MITAVVVTIQYVYNLFGNPILAIWDEDLRNYAVRPFSLRELLEKLYTGGVITQHWFLYAYLSFLLILPLLRKMAQNMKDEEFYLLFLLFVVSSFVFPFLERGLHFEPCDLQFPLLSNIILYPFLGYFCDRKENLAKGKNVAIFGLLSLLLSICNMILMERNMELFDDFHIFIYAMTLFIAVKYLFQRRKCPEKLRGVLLFCGKGVFGAYLFENMLRAFCEPVYLVSKPLLGQVPALLLFIISVMALGIIIVNFFLRIKKSLAFRQNSY